MKMRLGILFMLSTLYLSCNNNVKSNISIELLENTEWYIEIAENCESTLEFRKEGKYLDYNCEMEDTLFGTYVIEEGFILLYQEGSVYDKYLEENSSEIVGKAKFKLVLENDKLKYIEREDFFNDNWVKSKHTFSDNYFYRKKNH